MTSSSQASRAPWAPRTPRPPRQVVRRRASGQRRMRSPRCTRSLETCPYPPSPPLLPSPPSPPPPRPPPALPPSAVPPVPVELVRRCLLLRRSDAAAMGSLPARLVAERRVAPRSSGACLRGRRPEARPSGGAPRRRCTPAHSSHPGTTTPHLHPFPPTQPKITAPPPRHHRRHPAAPPLPPHPWRPCRPCRQEKAPSRLCRSPLTTPPHRPAAPPPTGRCPAAAPGLSFLPAILTYLLTHSQEGCGRHGRSPLGESFVTLSDSSTDDMPPKPTHGVRVAKGWSPCSRTGGAGGLR